MSLDTDPPLERHFQLLRSELESGQVAAEISNASAPGPSTNTVTKWLAAAARLHRSSASSSEFFQDAARFAVEIVDLDAAWVLSYTAASGTWTVIGQHNSCGITPESSVLALLVANPCTQYEPGSHRQNPNQSHFIVVSPVFSVDGDLIGAVYGVRSTLGENRRQGVRPLEARMIELLAESVAVGIARLSREIEAARTRVLLEQAFSPTVAEHIQRNPDCLSGQLREVTLLFADLRGFTTLAESLPPDECYGLLGEVMEQLTGIVMKHQGIVVDYYGDGLLALWNAPLDQPHHADLACAAAMTMVDTLPETSNQWRHALGSSLNLGVGVHSGPVLVGNAGTRSRLKYGPRGNNVNIASRVQVATRELELPLVVTSSTQRLLSDRFFTLRVCTARLPGLERPVELFAVYPASDTREVKARLESYAHALRCFEQGDFTTAETLLDELISQGPATPARFLARQASLLRLADSGRRVSDRSAQQGGIVEIREK